jgi:demethylmenaquinone methyltransferase/2-methoxy-6-polyprenyl-1,4-benzoquinol methylase
MRGATPEGARGESEAAALVRQMFARVARRYDLANHVLSFNIDRWWRARAVRRAQTILERPGARALDICCGTGDLTLALAGAAAASAQVFGCDFCHPMLTAAREKIARTKSSGPSAGGGASGAGVLAPARGGEDPAVAGRRTAPRCVAVFEADALRLPAAEGSLDLITAAFGFRNLANYDAGLREMRRVLRPGGMAAILEFSRPPNPAFRILYDFYSRRILPKIGGALTGSPDAYTYLPESVRKFPGPEELAQAMLAAGFERVGYELLTGGIAALHTGYARPEGPANVVRRAE